MCRRHKATFHKTDRSTLNLNRPKRVTLETETAGNGGTDHTTKKPLTQGAQGEGTRNLRSNNKRKSDSIGNTNPPEGTRSAPEREESDPKRMKKSHSGIQKQKVNNTENQQVQRLSRSKRKQQQKPRQRTQAQEERTRSPHRDACRDQL